MAEPEEKMIKQLENQIRDLKRELAEIQKNQALLRLQPCRGDSEIRGKDTKFYELDSRVSAINETIRGMTRKRQLLISEATIRGNDTPPSSKNSYSDVTQRTQKNTRFRVQNEKSTDFDSSHD
jgi:nucleotidyltransferase/DNA polymerase involved in DNA repair